MTTRTAASTASVPDDTAEVVAEAARTVDGVHALGRSVERASNAVRERVGLTRIVPGVTVELDRGGPARVAVSIVVDYPHKLREVSEAVREASRDALGGIGLGRVDIDVRVTDVWGPFDTEPAVEGEPARDGAPDRPEAAPAAETTRRKRRPPRRRPARKRTPSKRSAPMSPPIRRTPARHRPRRHARK